MERRDDTGTTVARSEESRGGQGRDLRTRDYATPDAEPATFRASTDDIEPLPNRRYTSILFWRLVKAMEPQREPARILDLGPTNQANVRFWGERGFRVTCHDLARHELEQLQGERITNLTLSPEKVRARRMPFDDESFSAICAWNVFARLPYVVARRYARECYRLMAPTGILHAIFLDAGGRLDARRRYRIADRQQLDVASGPPLPSADSRWVEADLAFMFSAFDACETKAAPCNTRELLAQRGPIRPISGDGRR